MEEKELTCSFCQKKISEVKHLIAGPSVYICDECSDLVADIIKKNREEELMKPFENVSAVKEFLRNLGFSTTTHNENTFWAEKGKLTLSFFWSGHDNIKEWNRCEMKIQSPFPFKEPSLPKPYEQYFYIDQHSEIPIHNRAELQEHIDFLSREEVK